MFESTEEYVAYLKEATESHYGVRCEDFEAECHCCKVWAAFDKFVEVVK
jgi:hypothetical protein